MNNLTVTAQTDDNLTRLDKFLSAAFPHISRSRLQQLLKENCVFLNGKLVTQLSHKVKKGDVYDVHIPPAIEATPLSQAIPLDIVYEDDHILIINKAVGMVVHPAPGHAQETLVNALLSHCKDSLSGIGGVKRPGIVHRLDKDTSGLMVVAKNDRAHNALAAQFSDRSLSRTYHALVWGLPSPTTGIIRTYMDRSPKNRQKMAVTPKGKEAVTHYRLLQTVGNCPDLRHHISLLECRLETGRTHQIRVHMAHNGHSIIGDPLYGHCPKKSQNYWPESLIRFPHQALHAKKLRLVHPVTADPMAFEAPYPQDFSSLLGQIGIQPFCQKFT